MILGTEEVISSDLVTREQEYFNPDIDLDGPISLKKLTKQAVRELEDAGWVTPALEWQSYTALWRALRGAAIDPSDSRYAVTKTIETIGGARPKTFEAFVREGQGELLAKSA